MATYAAFSQFTGRQPAGEGMAGGLILSKAQKSAPGHALPGDKWRCWTASVEIPKPRRVVARAKRCATGFAAVEAGLSSAAAGGSGLALFERSEFRQTPPDASSARNRAAALTSASLFFGYFLLAKQKKVARPPGRDPACRRQTATLRQQNPTCRSKPNRIEPSHPPQQGR